MKQLSHTNLIRLLGYDLKCEVKGRKAIVMVQQLAPKGELFDYLMYTKKFEEKQANALFKQLIAGLTAMHKAGIAHRDLKPENVLFDNQFNLKLADFGFAYVFQKGEGAKTSMRTELGTKGYMAPEIINNKKYTEKADIFAAGVILFIMLAGFPPFQNAVAKDWWFDKLMKQKYKLFWMAHERTAKFSSEAKDILQKMLAPKEADRHDVVSVTKSKFWNKECLTKDELVACLKRRKEIVDAEKAKEPEGESRDTLLEILLPEDKSGETMPKENPVLLKDVLKNQFVESLSKASNQKEVLEACVAITDMDGATAVRDNLSSFSDEQALKFAQTLAESAKLSPQDLVSKLSSEDIQLDDQIADLISNELKRSQLGKLDDYELVETFAQLDETAIIPAYDVLTAKTNSFRTKMSYGLLGYCLSKFMKGRGQLAVYAAKGNFRLDHKVTKKITLPEEKEDGDIQWRVVKMSVKISVLVQLAYDENQKINVLTFTNVSKSHMGMSEYAAIIKEVTENYMWLIRYFIDGVFVEDDDHLAETTNISADFEMVDGDVEGEDAGAEEEEVEAA